MLELGDNWGIIYTIMKELPGIADPSSNQYAWGSLRLKRLYWGIRWTNAAILGFFLCNLSIFFTYLSVTYLPHPTTHLYLKAMYKDQTYRLYQMNQL